MVKQTDKKVIGASWPVVGHAAQIKQLRQAVKESAWAHAYIFAGSEGCGRYLVARQFAQALLCTRENEDIPCGRCATCLQMQRSGHPDCLTLSPQEESEVIKITQVREAIAFCATRPYGGSHKVVLVRDADALTPEAQNAFLKTLEEPPAYVVIVLIVTHPERLLETITSRCQLLQFHGISEADTCSYLDTHNISKPEQELLQLFYGGQIGRMMTAVSTAGAIANLGSFIEQQIRLLAASSAERLLWVQDQGKIDMPYMNTFLSLSEALWSLSVKIEALGRTMYTQPALAAFLETIRTMPLKERAAYSSRLADVRLRLKAGSNYQLHLENLVLHLS
ncbi:MAG TPA: DNA polymerase III subunit delta' [bacterium]|nr:DNA polymerase III subunit delta' [bacterium]